MAPPYPLWFQKIKFLINILFFTFIASFPYLYATYSNVNFTTAFIKTKK